MYQPLKLNNLTHAQQTIHLISNVSSYAESYIKALHNTNPLSKELQSINQYSLDELKSKIANAKVGDIFEVCLVKLVGKKAELVCDLFLVVANAQDANKKHTLNCNVLTNKIYSQIQASYQTGKLNANFSLLSAADIVQYYNYQNYLQILLQLICDLNYEYQPHLYKNNRNSNKKSKLKKLKSIALTTWDKYGNIIPQKLNLPKLEKICNAIAEGKFFVRDLGNYPPNYLTPNKIKEFAKQLVQDCSNAKLTAYNEAEMQELGMNSLLAVSKGSAEEGCFLALEYKGDLNNKTQKIFVGKGVTFDTGGISLKPSAAMDEMKFDMLGAATVLGLFKTISILQPKLNLVVIVVTVENMPSSKATKPGDVVQSLSGQTIEVLNTDAEGRLILADALTYAQQNYQAEYIIDVATLTGACIVALGNVYSGIMGNDDKLISEIIKAGNNSFDRFWQLPLSPLGEDYDLGLESNFADVANISSMQGAGSSVGGQFLKRFIDGNVKWAHLDIAGSSWLKGDKKGATARPLTALVNFILN